MHRKLTELLLHNSQCPNDASVSFTTSRGDRLNSEITMGDLRAAHRELEQLRNFVEDIGALPTGTDATSLEGEAARHFIRRVKRSEDTEATNEKLWIQEIAAALNVAAAPTMEQMVKDIRTTFDTFMADNGRITGQVAGLMENLNAREKLLEQMMQVISEHACGDPVHTLHCLVAQHEWARHMIHKLVDICMQTAEPSAVKDVSAFSGRR